MYTTMLWTLMLGMVQKALEEIQTRRGSVSSAGVVGRILTLQQTHTSQYMLEQNNSANFLIFPDKLDKV